MYVPWVCVFVRGLNKPLQPSAAIRVFDTEFICRKCSKAKVKIVVYKEALQQRGPVTMLKLGVL